MAVPNLPSAAPLVGQVVLEWLPMRFVLLHADCLARMSQYTQGVERDREAGGILLGSYRGPHIEITAITEPLPKDVRARYKFDRSDPGHQVAAMSAWQSSAGTTTFAGEWHTHPESRPTPSSVDLGTWKKLIAKSNNPLAFVILGWSSNWYGIGFESKILPAAPV